jgi:DNA-binding transcriptional MerR regulator
MTKTKIDASHETYSIQEVSRLSGLSIPTLRYYEEIGLIPAVPRDKSSGHRRYSADTLQLIESLSNLRVVGFSPEEMREYVSLRKGGEETAEEKRELFRSHAREIGKQIALLEKRRRYLKLKIDYWDAQVRGDADLLEVITQEYLRIVKEMR